MTLFPQCLACVRLQQGQGGQMAMTSYNKLEERREEREAEKEKRDGGGDVAKWGLREAQPLIGYHAKFKKIC